MLKAFTVVLLICETHLSVISTPVTNGNQEGSWCVIEGTPENATGTMVCSFKEPVNHAELDFYSETASNTPDIAVTCFQICEVAESFKPMLRVEKTSNPNVLSLSVLSVPPRAVGKYRCQATSNSTRLTVEGTCNFNLTPPNASLTDKPAPSPSEEEAGAPTPFLLLLIILVVPAVVVPLIICKLKSCGPWKKRDEAGTRTSTEADERGSPPPFSYDDPSDRVRLGSGDDNDRQADGENQDNYVPLIVTEPENEATLVGDSDSGSDSDEETRVPWNAGKDEHPMMERVRSEFAESHSPATCKKRTMMRQELKKKFAEEKMRSQEK